MQCKNCGTQIADKALICYKCGTATTDAKYQPAPLRARRRPTPLLVTIVLLLLMLALAYYFHVR